MEVKLSSMSYNVWRLLLLLVLLMRCCCYAFTGA